jgi:hypothetical protein
VVQEFSCATTEAVFDEVVTKGKARLHQDAEEIADIISGPVELLPIEEHTEAELGLGAGESSILSLLSREQDVLVVSDDRRFLSVLSARKVSFLTPADVILVLAMRYVLTQVEAEEALERLRPLIRRVAYLEAKHELRRIRERNEK